jgi:hypothetical protein
VHAGLPAAEQGAPFLPGPVLAAPFDLIGPSVAPHYARLHPPQRAIEDPGDLVADVRAALDVAATG